MTRKPISSRKWMSFNPYSRSHYNQCIQHRQKCFQAGSVSIVVGPSGDSAVSTEDVWEGDVFTSVIEFKMSRIKVDQMLAEMLCTSTIALMC